MESIYSYVNDALNLYDASGVTAGYVDSDYPLSNSFDNKVTKLTKSTGTVIKVNFDFGANATLDVIAIMNHNFALTGDAAITTCSLAYGSTALAADTDDLTATGYIYMDTHLGYSRDGLFQAFTAVTARYWQIKIQLASDSPEFGEIWLGNQTDVPTPDFALMLDKQGRYNRTQSETGVVRERVLYVFRTLNLSYGLLIIDDKNV